MTRHEAQQQIAAFGDAAHVLLVGAGDGELVDAIDLTGSSARAIVLEPRADVAAAMRARDAWRRLLDGERLHLLTGPDYLGSSSVARHVHGGKPSVILVDDDLHASRPDAVRKAFEVARRIQTEAKDNFEARRKFAGRYLLHTLRNLPVIERSGDVSALDGAFPGVPAVIAAAGPSLDHSLSVLSEWQDRVVVIGADTTLRPLLAGGVRPHLIVGLDPAETNARHLKGVGDTSGTYLVGEASLEPSAFESFYWRTFTFRVSNHEPWPWLTSAGFERGALRAWGSVATSAFDLALRLGCNPIVFVGADMAFTGDRPYCSNTVFHSEWYQYFLSTWGYIPPAEIQRYERVMMDGRQHVPATDINGAEVKTTSHFIAFRDWLVEQTTLTTGTTFVNATGAGLLSGPRITQMALGEALQAHAARPVDARQRIAALHAGSKGAPGVLRKLAADLLVGFDRPPVSETISRWIEFTAGTVERDELRAVVSARLTDW